MALVEPMAVLDESASWRDLAVRSFASSIIDAPTVRRHKLSNTEISHQNYVLVRVMLENGVEGYGEASTLGGPRWAEESVESIKSVIDSYLAPALAGCHAASFEQNAIRLSKAASRNNAAKAAIEAALFDAVGKSLGLPAPALLGGAVRSSLSIIWALASGDAGQEIEEAKKKIEKREHRRFKVKIGFADPKTDIQRLTRIRTALGPDVEVIVDVNQAWSEATAMRWLPAFDELGISLIEQPLPAAQIEQLGRIAARTSIPVMVDEAVFTSADIIRAGQAGAGSVISLKLVKSGGLLELKRAAGVASAVGMELYGGCLLESGIGAAAHLAVFSTLPKMEWGTEQFGPKILVNDLVLEGPTYRDFEIHLPEGPGLGLVLDEDRIKHLTRAG
ncbi:muconate/chloromuconate family cycloisomerase [Phyllobacterium sp. YR531]|uniref:muconate/chloromuconate family cycloisomerase n=1 Tax=Phyllobacterium sp. YR531 TaxID=1144343 RepID=UPI00026FBA82|nr:muconate/chloromuconate family cycloisomerase [Phyllobacterium sp. YR531]EJN05852.1 muconate/chloromuconate cycloisomerase [Phyllobacterium sp. YR531]